MEWLKNNGDIIGTIITIGGAIVAIISWIKSAANAKEAKKEADLAKQYAKNADEANQSARKYYDEMIKHLEKQSEQIDRESLKKRILEFMASTIDYIDTSKIANMFKISKKEAQVLLMELKAKGYLNLFTPINGSDSQWSLKR
jgi:Fic family protein